VNDNITNWRSIWDSRPFTIGMRPLDQCAWFIVDENLGQYLQEKTEMLGISPDLVFREEISSRPAQAEVAAAIAANLSATCPEIFQFSGTHADIEGHGRAQLDPVSPLKGAARLVQEDLLLLQRREDGWYLTAGALCFPSSWTLAEKMGRRLDAIHDPVPGFGPGHRTAAMMARIFDNLPIGKLALRWNWGLHGDGQLAQPPLPDAHPRFADPSDPEQVFLRHERQTLARFPLSGAILFTVRLHVVSCAQLGQSEAGRAHAEALARQLTSLGRDQLAYKGLAKDRDALLEMLSTVVKGRGAGTP
jgi:dimethylamine monooxygenase subunit A